jgi:hypothetical protein
VVRSPYDEALRADLVRLLLRSGRSEEAEQQFRMGRRLLEEVGKKSEGLLAEARFDTPVTPRGPSLPIRTRSEATPAAGPAFAAPSSGTLVGREKEIDRLRRTFQETTESGRARWMLVQGEAGIGKSRLLEAGADLARRAGARVLQASAYESEMIRPFAVWIDALRALGHAEASSLFAGHGRDDRDQLFTGLAELVGSEANDQPVVLVFDDLQWCDESSAAALHFVAHANRGRPIFGLLAAREDELPDNAPLQQALRGLRRERTLSDLRLGPLGDESIGLLASKYGADQAPAIRSADCGGNPLLAIELARSAASGDAGGSLEELVRERMSRLDLDGADVLRWAAVLAPRVDVPILARLTGLDPPRVAEIIEAAERLALVAPVAAGFRFSHDLVSRCVYSDIAPVRRKVMHGRVAEIIEEDAAVDLDRASDLAHHASLCGDPALAARSMIFAGRLCLRFFANDEAKSLATRGLEWASGLSGAERIRLTIDLRDVELAAAPLDDWDAAARDYVQLAEQALDFGEIAHARLGYQMASYVRWLRGQWGHAREQTLQAARVTRAADDADQIIGMAETAKCLVMIERDLSQADAMLMEVRALAKRNRISHRAIPAVEGMLRFHRNQLPEAEESFLEARALCKTAGDRLDEFQANEYLVMIDLERGNVDAALERSLALLEIGERIREGSEAPFARALHGLCIYARDDDDAALEAALDELRLVDAKHRLAYASTGAALIDTERGRGDRALERAREALACAEALERSTDMALAHAVLARAYASMGDGGRAREHRSAIEHIDDASVATWARDRVRDLTGAG